MILEFTHRGTGDGTIGGTSVSTGGLTWTQKHSQLYATSAFSGKTLWTRATGNHSGQTVTGSGLTDSCAAIVTIYRGALKASDPLAGATIVGEQNASNNETQAQITTIEDNCFVVLVVANSPDVTVASQNSTSPGTLTERAEVLSTGGTDTAISHASNNKASAGATGSLTWAQANQVSGSWAYAIRPEPFPSSTSAVIEDFSGGDDADINGRVAEPSDQIWTSPMPGHADLVASPVPMAITSGRVGGTSANWASGILSGIYDRSLMPIEVYITIGPNYTQVNLQWLMRNAGIGTTDGYMVGITPTYIEPYRWDNGVITNLGQSAITMAAGQKAGIRHRVDGVIEVWVDQGAGWIRLSTYAADTTYSTGAFGMFINQTDSTNSADDLGAGGAQVATIVGVVAAATADGLAGSVAIGGPEVDATITGVAATADAAGLAGTVATQHAKTIVGVAATATAAGLLGTVVAQNIKAIVGVVATANAAGLLGTVAAQNDKDIVGVVATANADGVAGTVVAQNVKVISGVTALADAVAYAGRRQPAFILSLSPNIAAGGEDTTGQLSAPGGHSFGGGRIQDDENPTDAVDLAPNTYREDEWSIQATSEAIPGAVYDFRLVIGGNPVESLVTPQWTIGASGNVTIIGVAATANADGIAGSVVAERDKDIVGVTAAATADGLAGTVAAQVARTVAGQAASATADGLAGTVAALRVVSVAGAVATATADGIAGTVAAVRIVTIGGVVATASAAGLAGQILIARLISGVAATATATGNAGVVVAQNVKLISGITATATASGNAGIVIVVRTVNVNGAVATANADGYAGTVVAQNSKTISGALATATADGLAGTVAAQRVVTISGIGALADAAGLAGIVLTGGVVNILGAVATATADGNAGSVVVFRIATVVGITATATAAGLAGQVQVARTIAGALATANAAGLAGTILAQRIVAIGGITATATADGLAGAVQSAGNKTILGIAATANAAGNPGTVVAQVTVTISGEAATALAEGVSGVVVTTKFVTILGAIATALATGHAGVVVLADGTVIYIEATATLAQDVAGVGTVAIEVAATASYTEARAQATRPLDNVEATASQTEALATASREI
jgi:hypothetical protein